MAYLVDYDRKCSSPGCEKRAVVEVRNTVNATNGYFCRPHGERRVKDLNESERAS